MNLELLKIYLDEWKKRSDRFKGGPRGFPRRSVGFSSGGYQSSLEDMEHDSDRQIIAALDTIIYNDLPETQRLSVLVVTGQMPNVFKTNRKDLDMESILEMALRSIWQGLDDRDLV